MLVAYNRKLFDLNEKIILKIKIFKIFFFLEIFFSLFTIIFNKKITKIKFLIGSNNDPNIACEV